MIGLKRKFKYNGEEYTFPTDTTPIENSSNAISSGAVFTLLQNLASLIGVRIVPTPANNGTDLVTSGGIYKFVNDAITGKASYDVNSNHLSTLLRQNVIHKFDTTYTRPESNKDVSKTTYANFDNQIKNVVGGTYFDNNTKQLIYVKSRSEGTSTVKYTYYVEEPQKFILYYDLEHNTLCYWNGSSLVNVN